MVKIGCLFTVQFYLKKIVLICLARLEIYTDYNNAFLTVQYSINTAKNKQPPGHDGQ